MKTFTRSFGVTAAVLTVGLPLATLSAVAGFVLADLVTNWRYRRAPNLPPASLGAFGLDDTAELFVPDEWREPWA